MKISTFAFVRLIAILMLIIHAPLVKASSGFQDGADGLPKSLKRVWPSTFLVTSTELRYSGSAFLIRAPKFANTSRFYFLTNRHVIKDLGCDQVGPCAKGLLTRDFAFASNLQTKLALTDSAVEIASFVVLKISTNPDLALLAVDGANHFQPENEIDVGNCAKLDRNKKSFLFGYPGMYHRIPDASCVERVSFGMTDGLAQNYESDDGPSAYRAITNDSLPGNSGGPAIDIDGGFIGVMFKSSSQENNRYRYGDGSPEYPQSYTIPCETVNAFLSTEPSS